MSKKEEAAAKERARQKAWRDRNKEHRQAYQKQWRERNALAVAEYQKEYQAEYQKLERVQSASWARGLMKNYGITPAEFMVMFAKQKGACAICCEELKIGGRAKNSAAVDHNHHTGKVRGILCRQCNHGIGSLQDDPDVLRSAAFYLLRHGYRDEHLYEVAQNVEPVQ